MFKTLQPLILASGSPRRKLLLQSVGLEFRIEPSKIDEMDSPSGPPVQIAEKLACLKSGSISALFPHFWILGADTVVVLDGQLFGKPLDHAQAIDMLNSLSGRVHEVITGLSLINDAAKIRRSGAVVTRVQFKVLSGAEIEAYVRTSEPMDKAGSYGIQGIGSFLVQSIEGSYTNVVGLPLCETLDWLMGESVIEPE